jgi:SynChlorMet cassette protein ScmC
MPDPSQPSQQFTGITLANGRQWLLCPTDPEAVDIISRLAEVMQLSPGQSGRKCFVTVQARDDKPYSLTLSPLHPVCILPPGNDDAMRAMQMMMLGKTMVLQTLPEGGMLLHGALVTRDGYGVILAGPGTVGKSTASRRIPLPWRSLCDDATLVIPDRTGQYCAHPYPTWSRFFENGPKGTWAVEQAVPLRAIFLLSQSDTDHAEPVDPREATVFLMESIRQVMGSPVRIGRYGNDAEEICRMELSAVNALVKAVPVNQLHLSLTGRFWDVIEQCLESRQWPVPVRGKTSRNLPEDQGTSVPAHPLFQGSTLPVVYTGTSMNPVLREQDLLEVAPWGDRAPAVGDVICFFDPEQDVHVIHRIIELTPAGFRTQGDNSNSPDRNPVMQKDSTGIVVMAWQGKLCRRISGGSAGQLTRTCVLVKRHILAGLSGVARLVYPAPGQAHVFQQLLPRVLKLRVVLFTTPESEILRLFLCNTQVGEYSDRKKTWTVRFPFLLLVNTSALPTGEQEKPGILS